MKLAKLTSARTFGIEIEFNNQSNLTQSQLANHINSKFRRLECLSESYNHNTNAHWKIVTDSTCGLELVSPILSGQQGMKEAQDVIDTLHSVEGVQVNRSCGIHVHVGCEDITPQGMKNVIIQYAKNETLINSVLAPSRRDTRWARQIVGNEHTGRFTTIQALKTMLDGQTTCSDIIQNMGGRYNTVNVQCWNRQRTIEFRQHGGSLDSEKILSWAHFLINTVEKCMTETPVKTTIRTNPEQAFKQLFGNSKIVYDFMLGRANHFGFTQYGQVKEVSVVTRWEAVCEEEAILYTVNKLSNGGFEVKADGNAVGSVKQTLRGLLGIVDSGETTRQLGNLLLTSGGTNLLTLPVA